MIKRRTNEEQIEIIANNLNKLMKDLGLSQVDIANVAKVSESAVSNWLAKRNAPSMGSVQLIADNYNIRKSDLLEDKSLPDGLIPIIPAKRIPILGSVACGTPIFSEQNIEDYFVTNDIIKADFCLYAKGDSMIGADINDGDLVFIRKTPAVDNGKIAVVLIGEETTLKRVYKTDHNLILHAENRTYQPLIYTEKDCETENIMVLGEMIGIYKNIKQ